jgi:hypothetical protein
MGVKGDGATDDTAAIRHAIEAHRVLYFPSGHYVVRDTITLKPDTVIIGLHPTLTQIDLLDETPAYQGVGAPKPVILAPSGGANILSGIGLFTGGINPRAVAVLWKAGEQSQSRPIEIHSALHCSGDGSIQTEPRPHRRMSFSASERSPWSLATMRSKVSSSPTLR